MSLDMTQLSILATSGTEKQKAAALKVMPVRKNGHQVGFIPALVSLVILFRFSYPLMEQNAH
jgi:hypothetical protein